MQKEAYGLEGVPRGNVPGLRCALAFSVVMLCGLCTAGVVPSALADTMYTYVGNPYNMSNFPGASCPPCGQLSGSFIVSQPLADNLSAVTLTTTSFNFNDGSLGDTWTGSGFLGFVSTDANGNLTGWLLAASFTPGFGSPFFGLTFVMQTDNNIPPGCAPQCTADFTLVNDSAGDLVDSAGIGLDPGTWTKSSVSPVPEPSSLLLLTSGLVSLGFLRRRFLRA